MNEFFSTQFTVFGFSCFLGVMLGFLYDCFRLVRLMINPKNIFIFIQDIIYFFISALITFLFVLVFNNGESRFYILAGEGMGWILYHLTLGELIYKCSEKIVSIFKRFIKKILLNFRIKISKIYKKTYNKFLKK